MSAAVRDLPVDILFNPDWEEGLAGSLRLAAATLASARADSSSACLLLACDQPALEATHLAALREGFITHGCAATRHGEGRGIPAWVPADLLAQAISLQGDHGLRGLLSARAPERIALLDAPELAHTSIRPTTCAKHAGAAGSIRLRTRCRILPPKTKTAGRRRPFSRSRRRRHNARNAVVIGRRAARSAGNRPPTRPMPSAHLRPFHNSSGVTLNWNTTWLKLLPRVETL